MNEFKDELRAVISNSNITQKKASEILGVPLRSVESWVEGKRVPDKFKQQMIIKMLSDYKAE